MSAIQPINVFGEPLPTRPQLLDDKAVREFLTATIQSLLAAAGTPESTIAHATEALLSLGQYDDRCAYPEMLFRTLLEYAPISGREPFHFESTLAPNKVEYLAAVGMKTSDCVDNSSFLSTIDPDVAEGRAFLIAKPFSLIDSV